MWPTLGASKGNSETFEGEKGDDPWGVLSGSKEFGDTLDSKSCSFTSYLNLQAYFSGPLCFHLQKESESPFLGGLF